MSKSLLSTAILVSLLLTGCSVGPDHVRPVTETGASFTRQEASATVSPESEFWRRFGDPLLSGLVDDALVANHDLRIALARLDAARALSRETRFDLLPTITAGVTRSETRASTDQQPGTSRDHRESDSNDASLRAAWELDFFGRVRRGVQAQRAESDAAAADLAAMQVTIAGEVAQAYFSLRGQQAQLDVARGNAENQQDSLDLVSAQLEAGRGTEFDTARAGVQLQSTLARIPALQAEAAVSMHRLAVLTGRMPAALVSELEAPYAGVPLLDPVAAGAPGELLRRRPDIAAAEYRLAAATARVGVATADLFPRFSLGALLGSQAGDSGSLFGRDSETRWIALGVDWSFLDTGRVRARIAGAEAGADENLARYEQAVLAALEETENALVRHQHARTELALLEVAAEASVRASTLARLRFDGGLVDLLQVLDAERAQLDAEDRLAQSRARTAGSLVAVYRALAGGWPERVPQLARANAVAAAR